MGNPLDAATNMGALISKEHLQKVRGYVNIARADGATIRCGDGVDSLELPAENARVGWHLSLTDYTSFANVRQQLVNFHS